jgi:hypothetical protein
VKTAIGTLINTGTVVGAGSSLFGGSLPPTWVPPFSWGSDPGGPTYDRDRFLALAQRVLERRDVEFTENTNQWLASCWDAARRGYTV